MKAFLIGPMNATIEVSLSWRAIFWGVNVSKVILEVNRRLRPGEVFMFLSFSCFLTDICQGYSLDLLRLCICFQLKWSRCENPGLSIVFALLVTPRRIRIYFNPPEDSTHSRAGSHTLKWNEEVFRKSWRSTNKSRVLQSPRKNFKLFIEVSPIFHTYTHSPQSWRWLQHSR